MARIHGKMDFIGTIGGARIEAGLYDLYSSGVLSLNTLNDLTLASDNRNISMSGQNIFLNASGLIHNLASQASFQLDPGEYITMNESGVTPFDVSNGFIGGPCSGIDHPNNVHIISESGYISMWASYVTDFFGESAARIRSDATVYLNGANLSLKAYDPSPSPLGGDVDIRVQRDLTVGDQFYQDNFTPRDIILRARDDIFLRVWNNGFLSSEVIGINITQSDIHFATLSGVVPTINTTSGFPIYPHDTGFITGACSGIRSYDNNIHIESYGANDIFITTVDSGDIYLNAEEIIMQTQAGVRPTVNGSGIAMYDELGGGGTSIHNNLTGLQGGVAGEYYHLTQEEYEDGQLFPSGYVGLGSIQIMCNPYGYMHTSGVRQYLYASDTIGEFNIYSKQMDITLAPGEFIHTTTPTKAGSGVATFDIQTGFIGEPCSGIETGNNLHLTSYGGDGIGDVLVTAGRDIYAKAGDDASLIAENIVTASGGDAIVAAYDPAKSLGAIFVLSNNAITLGSSNYADPYTPEYIGVYSTINADMLVQGGPQGGHGLEVTVDSVFMRSDPEGGNAVVSGGIALIRAYDIAAGSGIVNIYPDAGTLLVGKDDFARPFTPENIDMFSTDRIWQKIYNGSNIIGVECDGNSDNQIDFITSDGKRPAVNGSGIAFESELGGGGGNHNDLAGLQGGTSSEYYHLTEAEYNGALFPSGYVGDGAIDIMAPDGNVTVSGQTTVLTAGNAGNVGLTIDDGTDHQFDFATTNGKRPHVNGSGVLLEGESATLTEAYFFGRLTANIDCMSTLQDLDMDHGDILGLSHTDGTNTVNFDTAGRYIIDVFLRTTYNIGGHLATLQASYWNGSIMVLLDDRQVPMHATSNNHVHLRYFYNTSATNTYWTFKVKTTKTLPGRYFTVEDSYVIITREYEE